MALATLTLDEVSKIPNLKLFEDIPYIDYDYVQKEIMDEFGEREIAYETPFLFARKLNHQLRLHCDSYNKMIRSQVIELDPFVTEYSEYVSSRNREDNSGGHREVFGHGLDKTENLTYTEGDSISNTDQKSNENTDSAHVANKAGHETEITDGKKNATTNVGIHEDAVQNVVTDATENTHTTDITDTTQTTHSNTKLDETSHTTSEQGTVTNVSTTDNQTGLEWTEKGSSQGHNLAVHSDTPALMLFNEPNHYYGTGRAHDYGVVQHSQDGDYYEHYPETEPSEIDEGSYDIGSDDTPWFNYATNADNTTGHDSYAKSGTETFEKEGTSDTDQTFNEDTTVDHDATTTFEELVHSVADRKIDTERDYTEHKDTKASTDRTEDTTYNEVTHGESTKDFTESLRENTNTKNDRVANEVVTGKTSDRTNDLTDRTTDTSEHAKTENYNKSESIQSSIRKGRSNKSPAQLLAQYRETLTFNADMWLLGELEPLFLQLF